MISKQFGSSIALAAVLYFSFISPCSSALSPLHKREIVLVKEILIPITHIGFPSLNLLSGPIALLQEDGYVDTIHAFPFVLPPNISLSDLSLTQESSDENVLSIPSNMSVTNVLLEPADQGVVNITSTVIFDNLVGLVRYTLNVFDARTNQMIDKISVWYRIIGMTFFRELPSGEIEIVSGDGNEYAVPFEQAMNTETTWKNEIKVFIQYADGTTSQGISTSELSDSDSLNISATGVRGQITHDEDMCDVGKIGSQSISGKPLISLGCGFGFYHGVDNQLAFGFLFHDYRVGSFSVHFSWMGINNRYPALATEYFELSLHVRITGTPPLVVVGIDPITALLRGDGGEMRIIEMINVDVHDAIAFEVRVSQNERTFKMIPNSYISDVPPDHIDKVSILSEPGSGVSLVWELFYQTRNGSASASPYQPAMFHPSFIHLFSYDVESLRIDSIDPQFADEETGEVITVRGYFPYFNQKVDSINFSGTKLPQYFITLVSRWEIQFTLPKRGIFGSSYDFHITIRIGFGESNAVLFSYYLSHPVLSFRYYGVTRVSRDTYRLTNCSFAIFTAALSPFSSQVQGFKWALYSNSNSTQNLLTNNPMLNATDVLGQSLRLESDLIYVGSFLLKCEVQMIKSVVVSEVILVRDSSLALGTSILPIGDQSLAEMGSILRFTAIVHKPVCLVTNRGLLYEWQGFGHKALYSWRNETDVSAAIEEGDLEGVRPTRLGLEFSISREKVSVGEHSLTFRVWLIDDQSIYGMATTSFSVYHGPLVAVIRSGEKRINANYYTTLSMYANLSFDSSIHDERRFEFLSYEWECLQSRTESFSSEDAWPCEEGLLPLNSIVEFSVSLKQLMSDRLTRFVKYSLTVTKIGRKSSPQSLVVEISDSASLPHLDRYSIHLTDIQGNYVRWDGAEYFQDIFINIKTTANSSWSFALMSPSIPDFLSSYSIVEHSAYYSPPSTINDDSGSQKPLGIKGNVLRPSTTYAIRITICSEESNKRSDIIAANTISSPNGFAHEKTEVLIVIQTVESVVVHMLPPKPTNATLETYFALYAGVSAISNHFFYQFTLTDSLGNNYCCGGCTGMDIAYFFVPRPDNYTLSVVLTDDQGHAITSMSTNTTIQVHDVIFESTTVFASTIGFNEYRLLLQSSFEYGNDRQWLMVAHDVSIMIAEKKTANSGRMLTSYLKTKKQPPTTTDPIHGLALEQQHTREMGLVMDIAQNSTAIFCNSYPNTYLGKDCMALLRRLSEIGLLELPTFYYLLEAASCCIKRTPSDVIVNVLGILPTFISNMGKLARTWIESANSRRRLLQFVGEPANAVADLNIWTGDIIAYAAASGMVNGFADDYDIGHEAVPGHISIVSASERSHLLEYKVNGIIRRIVGGATSQELFYPRDSCILKLFNSSKEKRRVFTFLTLDNFVLLGFQDPPVRSNLVDKLYWMQVFERGPTGLLQTVPLRSEAYCYCWKLPVIRLQQELENAVDDMPGLYGFSNMKTYRSDATSKGEVYSYDYGSSKTSDYNTSEGWVEGCQIDVGLVSTTVVSKSASNILEGGLTILGFSAWAIVGLVVGGVVLIMVAIVSSWLVAVQAVAESPVIPSEAADAYVERDIYGRGTGLGVNTML